MINTILIMIPCLAVAGLMVQQANVDKASVTGFEKTVPVQSVSRQIRALFPMVDDVKVGTLESVDEDGNLISKTSIILHLLEDMDEQETGSLERWLEELYDGSCNILYVTDTDTPSFSREK